MKLYGLALLQSELQKTQGKHLSITQEQARLTIQTTIGYTIPKGETVESILIRMKENKLIETIERLNKPCLINAYPIIKTTAQPGKMTKPL